ncbi:ATP-binding protein [Pseudoalteromonas sp. SMS1]|uniref:two-component regulator propeller domain-containing protein n=1 Tax=Pseudoalteromonas sp. SMS1 TaxID=2908894 RepID=UPI001F388024|nr:two-component regulator propeller domain-containing protein [Pseudoalteromonas sp. SMS1]MCF2855880.1 ATP-binding protein [Pseudoalteromonas sp. SMS1]
MVRIIFYFLTLALVFESHSNELSPERVLVEIQAKQIQSANWQNVSQLRLPIGQPALLQSTQVNPDMSRPIDTTEAISFDEINLPLSYEHILEASFEHQTVNPQFSHWRRVKPTQYELNTLSDIRHFSPRQGLPTGSVYEVVQDVKGHLWLATNGEGLCQYIAEHFRCFNDRHGLSNNRVWDIEQMASGEFALATDKGVNLFNGDMFKTLTIKGEKFEDKVSNIAIVSDVLYFSTGLALYRYHHETLEKLSLSERVGSINDMHGDQDTLLIATQTGLYKFYAGALTLFNFDTHCQGQASSVTSSKEMIAFSIVGSGICMVDKTQQRAYLKTGIASLNVTALLIDEMDNAVWVGDDSKGVFKIDRDRVSTFNKKNGLSDQHIRGLMQDGQGHIWASTYGAGLNRIKDGGFRLLTKRSGLHRERISAMANIEGQLWLGQYGTGIQVFDEGQWLTVAQRLFNSYVHALAQDSEGRVWVGTRQGVSILGNQESLHIWRHNGLAANIIHQIARARDGCMYLATEAGLYRSCAGKLQFLELNTAEYVIDVFIDHTDNVWFVTNGGGSYFIENHVVYRFNQSDGLPSDWAYSIEQGKDTTMYLGTRNGVFALKRQEDTWLGRHINTDDGLSSHIVLGLKILHGELWVGTEHGNNRIRTAHLFDLQYPIEMDSFVYDNGYLAVDATLNTAEFIDDTFFWGSGSGVIYFDPNEITLEPNLSTSILEVASLSHTGEHHHAPLNGDVEFSPETQQIVFRVSHSDWANPERVMYQSRLLGSSEYWSEPSTSSEITYNQLAPGHYVFQVRSFASGSVGDHISYPFTVLSPWWRTWWAYTIALFTILMLMYQAIKWRFSFLAKQQRIKDRAEFSEALLERKKQLLAEVSHEIRTPLSVLKMSIEGLEYNLTTDTEKTYELLHRRIGDINLLVADIDQLARTELEERILNLAPVPVKSWLLAWIADANGRITQRRGYTFEYEIDVADTLKINADIDRLTQVLTNLLSNSIRYSACPANIHFRAKSCRNALVLSISDSAPGVLESELKTIFERMYQSEQNKSLYKGGTGLGLAICQDLVARHGGDIIATHSELGGVKVSITLPILP